MASITGAGAETGWEANYVDPLRWRFHDGPELRMAGHPRVDSYENELCSAKTVVMHKPTHAPQCEESGRYPFSAHLAGKRRLWEIRLQVKFKQRPSGSVYFGVELGKYVAVSTLARQTQKALVNACQQIVGDCYHSLGDDPTAACKEKELPCCVMPLWAVDQFIVTEAGGTPPDLLSDMSSMGMRRTDNRKEYIRAMMDLVEAISPDRTYTFLFWGVSQFLDVVRWEAQVEMGGKLFGGVAPRAHLNFNKLCGSPPVFLVIYDLAGEGGAAAKGARGDSQKGQKHLQSMKRYFWRLAVSSTLAPASGAVLQDEDINELTISAPTVAPAPAPTQPEVSLTPVPAVVESFDLLGLDTCPPKAEVPTTVDAPLCDLLA
mmetsp:Transcript_62028/g.115119  ORF Transcript_62028/g.115119 Transcript_62028/m.115119 type:complete len:375 (-) Transcript_62028:65-1189(-)